MFAVLLLLVLLVIFQILLHTQLNLTNVFFSVQPGFITFQWKHKQSSMCSEVMAYDHLSWDVERISNSPPVDTYASSCPLDQDVTRLHTPDKESSGHSQSSFIRTVSHMVCLAFETRKVDSMQIGIIKSVREAKTTKPGNEIAFVYCHVSNTLTRYQIGEILRVCIQDPSDSSPIATIHFLRSDMIFNSWRNVENFSNRTSNTQLVKSKNTTNIDYSKPHLYTILSNDQEGWYVVEHTCINSIVQHMHQVRAYIMAVTVFLLFYFVSNKPCPALKAPR